MPEFPHFEQADILEVNGSYFAFYAVLEDLCEQFLQVGQSFKLASRSLGGEVEFNEVVNGVQSRVDLVHVQ